MIMKSGWQGDEQNDDDSYYYSNNEDENVTGISACFFLLKKLPGIISHLMARPGRITETGPPEMTAKRSRVWSPTKN